jgi:cytochrome o ubiquinol oxidase subunit III
MSNHAATGAIDHHHDHTTTTGIPNKKLFMWAFLASDCMFFGALISTHLIYRLHPTPNQPDVVNLFSIELTSFSTFILLMSSLLMALAVNACQKGRVGSTRKMLLGTIVFGLIFLTCQVYEFTHFVHQKGLTLSSSMFGTTFYTLTGTHGCHVAIGVLWLTLMYIRSFKPADGSPWILKSFIHLIVFAVTVVATIKSLLTGVHVLQEFGATGEAFSTLVHHELPALCVAIVGLLSLVGFAFSGKAVEFGEANAIDVESMGLYWHFVDIVWIVIFTAVYLLEYL